MGERRSREECLRGLARVLVSAAIRIETERQEAAAVDAALNKPNAA